MQIGDEVYIHGYIDELRGDTVIIRNDGGYFGTVPSEMFYYEEDRNGYGTLNEADTPQTDCDTCRHYKLACNLFSEICRYEPKTEPQTRLTAKCLECNNSKACKENHWEGCRYEPLGYEVTAVVGTIKDEPQTERSE